MVRFLEGPTWAVALTAWAVIAGCNSGFQCGEGTRPSGNTCVPVASDGSDPAEGGDGSLDGGDGATGQDAAPDVFVGGTCALATGRALAIPDTYAGTLAGASRLALTCCGATGTGPEEILPLHVAARTGITVSTLDAATTADTVVAIRRDCAAAASELACDDNSTAASGAPPGSFVRAVLEPGDYFVVVDSNGAGGTYALSVGGFTPAPEATCATAVVLTATAPLRGQAVEQGGALSNACTPSLAGPQRFYAVTIPPHQLARFTATATGVAAWSPVLCVRDSCDAATCIASGYGTTGAGVATLANAQDAPRTVVLAVSGGGPTTVGTFDLALALTPLAANAQCTAAAVLSPTSPSTAGDLTLGGAPPGACHPEWTGPTLYYAIPLQPLQGAVLRLGPTMLRGTQLRLLDACDATTCIASNPGSYTNDDGHAAMLVANTSSAPHTYYLAVGSGSGTAFTISAQFGPVERNASCDTPADLVPGAPLMGTSAEGGPPHLCGATVALNPTLYYRVHVPAHTRAIVSATNPVAPGLGTIPIVQLTGCGVPPACSDGLLQNDGDAPRDVLVAIAAGVPLPGSGWEDSSRTFTVSVAFTTLAAGSTCGSPTPLGASTTVTGQDLAHGGVAAQNCSIGGFTGSSLYYGFTIPPGGRATFVATRASGNVPGLAAAPACDPTAYCRTGSYHDTGECGPGTPATNTLTLTNPASTPYHGVLAATDTCLMGGVFDLSATITP